MAVECSDDADEEDDLKTVIEEEQALNNLKNVHAIAGVTAPLSMRPPEGHITLSLHYMHISDSITSLFMFKHDRLICFFTLTTIITYHYHLIIYATTGFTSRRRTGNTHPRPHPTHPQGPDDSLAMAPANGNSGVVSSVSNGNNMQEGNARSPSPTLRGLGDLNMSLPEFMGLASVVPGVHSDWMQRVAGGAVGKSITYTINTINTFIYSTMLQSLTLTMIHVLIILDNNTHTFIHIFVHLKVKVLVVVLVPWQRVCYCNVGVIMLWTMKTTALLLHYLSR